MIVELVKGLDSIGEMSKIVKDSSSVVKIFFYENITSLLAIYVFYHIFNSKSAIYR